MTIFTDTYIPYEFKQREQCFKHIKDVSHGLKKAIKLVEKDDEHLKIRCPLSGDYLTVTGTENDLLWLHNELKKQNLYRL